MEKLTILPQKTQDNESIFLLDSNIAVCENGKILYYDDLGKIHDSNFECILESITQESDVELIKSHIIDLESIVIGFVVVDLVNFTINRMEKFSFINEDIISFRGFKINLETLEVAGERQELEELLENPPPLRIDEETQEKINAIVCAIYRKNIENFIEYDKLIQFLNSTNQ